MSTHHDCKHGKAFWQPCAECKPLHSDKQISIYNWMGGDCAFHKRGEQINWQDRHAVMDQYIEAGFSVMFKKAKVENDVTHYTLFIDTQRFQQR